MVNLSPMFLLFIEPTAQDENLPINDALTSLIRNALYESITGTSNYSDECNSPSDIYFNEGDAYRGCQSTPNNIASSNKEHRLKNGLVTNGCAIEYVRSYRNAIPKTEIVKLKSLARVYDVTIDWDRAFNVDNTVDTPVRVGNNEMFSPEDLEELESDF